MADFSLDLSPVRSITPRAYYSRRVNQLKSERESFISHYKELSQYIQPRRGRFFTSDRNRGTKRHQSILNSTATQALRTATSGMLAGTMSPTRPWFALETVDQDTMENQNVKDWLYQVELILRAILNESNFYGQASTMLSELLLFGTGAMSHLDDFEDVARFYTHTVGSYMIAQNDRFTVDTVAREFDWTAAQIVEAFGIENVSESIKTAIATGSYENWYTVTHVVEPNNNFRPSSPFAQDMPYKSVYYESGNGANDGGSLSTEGKYSGNQFLDISGFEEFPIHVPRWDVTGDDIYGTNCSGMTSLGDTKQLQIMERRKAQAVDKMVHPPLTGPASVRNVPIDSLPGGATLYDQGGDTNQLRALYQVDPRINEMRVDIDAVEQRINQAFFVDLFLAISTAPGVQPRNQLDLMARNEERLLQLGPVLERLQGEFLDPMINRLFNQCVRAGILPPAPEQLRGSNLKIKYVSTLAQAQRAVATQSIDRLTAYVGVVGELQPQSLMKFNGDQAIDEYARAVGAMPQLVVPDDVVEKQRAAMAEKQAQAEALAAAQQGAGVAQQLSNAKLDDDNLLSEAIDAG